MKQLKVDPPPPTLLPPPIGPRYRYFSNPPETLSLRAGDLIPLLPDGAWTLGSDTARLVELPAAEIFRGPIPQISLHRLADLAPECFRRPEGSDPKIRLPLARLASAYRLVEGRELIEEAVPFAPPVDLEKAESPDPAAPVEEPFAPPVVIEEPVEEPVDSTPIQVEEPISFAPDVPEPPAPESVIPPEPPPAPPIEPPAPFESLATVEPPAPLETPAAKLPPPPPTRLPAPPIIAPPVTSAATPPAPPRTLFSVLPIFRRKPAAENLPTFDSPPKRPRAVIPSAKAVIPPAPISSPLGPPPPEVNFTPEPEPAPPEAAAPPPPVEPPPPPATARWVETEHLTKSEAPVMEPRQHDQLQALFLTEEILTIDRVVELCGDLPGIDSCVLSYGAAVISSHKVPDTIDLVSLSAHALEMLRAMRESSTKMGIGTIPAVTLHSEKGPITFFQEEDLCLLVLHKDRGFVPGVREKLNLVVKELVKAKIPKPLSVPPPRILEG